MQEFLAKHAAITVSDLDQYLSTQGTGKKIPVKRFSPNPGGPFLPANQEELEVAYRRELKQQHGITFNGLLTITNMLTGRFKDSLIKNGDLNNTLEHCFGCTAKADSSCNRSLEKVLND